MAWRISDHIVRGEIDNRTRGYLTGRIWFAGRDAPVELKLSGNAWRDLAGRRLEFINPMPEAGTPTALATHQIGVVSDITASRKVKVPDIPLEEIGAYFERRQPWPWHWANGLYLEWFSEANGRVVIESATFRLTVSPETTWDMSAADEREQQQANAAALTDFMGRLSGPVDESSAQASDDEAGCEFDFSDDRPQSEEEAERMLADSDQLVDRITGRMDREGADFSAILEEELERRRRKRGEPPLSPEEEEAREQRVDDWNRITREAANDPEVRETADVEHPLALRARGLAVRLLKEPEEHGWISESAQREHPVAELSSHAMQAAAKLAGALDGREWPPGIDDCGLAIAWLKRARGYLGDALAAADACADERLVTSDWLADVRAELTTLAAATDALIAELRAILERGFD